MFDAELLKTMAAEAVNSFISGGIPLNDSITKIAMARDLNDEQVKRLVELSNQVTYLKLQESAQDRTFTFPLADSKMVKVASIIPDFPEYSSLLDDTIAMLNPNPLVKSASLVEPEAADLVKEASAHQSARQLMDAKVRCEAESESLSIQMMSLGEQLQKEARMLVQDPWVQEKMNEYTGPGADLMEGLLPDGMSKKASTLPSGMFSSVEMKQVRKVGAMLKQASDMLGRHTFLQEELKKIAGVDLRMSLLKTPFEHAHVAVHSVPTRNAGAQVRNSVRQSYMGAKGSPEAGIKIGPVATEGRAQPLRKSAENFRTPSGNLKNLASNYRDSLAGLLTGSPSNAHLKYLREKSPASIPGIGAKAMAAMDVGFGAQMIQKEHSVWDALHKTPEA